MKTPYIYDKGVNGIFDANDNQVADINCSIEVANDIIRACNSHDDLVAALKTAQACMSDLGDGMYNNAKEQVYAAIAKAEGK